MTRFNLRRLPIKWLIVNSENMDRTFITRYTKKWRVLTKINTKKLIPTKHVLITCIPWDVSWIGSTSKLNQ